MNIAIELNQVRVHIANPKVWKCRGAMLHLNKQHDGTWHLIHGERPVPHMAMLKAIEFGNPDQHTTTLTFVQYTNSVQRPAILVYKKAAYPYIQIEEDQAGRLTVYMTEHFRGVDFPQALTWEH